MFINVFMAWQLASIVVVPFAVAWARNLKDEYLIDFLNASKTFPEAHNIDEFYVTPHHPAGWFDDTALENWFSEKYNIDLWSKDSHFYYEEMMKTINIYRKCGLIERKCYWNHYIYRVR